MINYLSKTSLPVTCSSFVLR